MVKHHLPLVSCRTDKLPAKCEFGRKRNEKKIPITILRDAGAKQSLAVCCLFHLSLGSDVLAWGVKMSALRVPLHFVQLSSRFLLVKLKMTVSTVADCKY